MTASLAEELNRIAEAAREHASGTEDLSAVIPAEPVPGILVYVCAFSDGEGWSWLVLDGATRPVLDRELVRGAVSIAALCELAEESAAGGRLDELRARLDEVRHVELGEIWSKASEALSALEATLEEPPRIASSAYLDRIGAAVQALEQALGERGTSPFAESLRQGAIGVEGLTAEVEGAYKASLS